MQTVYKAMSLQTLKQENIFDLFLKISSNQRKKPTFSFCTDGLKNTSKRIYRILAMNNDSLMWTKKFYQLENNDGSIINQITDNLV